MLILLTEVFYLQTSPIIKVDKKLWNNKLRTKQLLRLMYIMDIFHVLRPQSEWLTLNKEM